jgi:putative sterol carrier protein
VSEGAQRIDTSAVDAEEFARDIGKTPDAELRAAMRGPLRDQILTEIFRRMEQRHRPQRARNAVIHWRIGDRPEGGEDHWEATIADGACTTTSAPRSVPRVTLKLDGVNFLKLVTGNASGPMLFMTGKLKIEGDLMFAAQIPAMFAIPG